MTGRTWLAGPVVLAAVATLTLTTSGAAADTTGVLGFDEADLINPTRGQYENLNLGLFPQNSPLNANLPGWPGSAEVSVRIPWARLQPTDPAALAADAPDEQRYDFAALDAVIDAAGDAGQRVGFRVTAFDSCCAPATSGDVVSSVPAWLRDVAGATTSRERDGVTYVIPDWNHPAYLTQFTDLVSALGRRYDSDERVAMFEMSGYGDFSENHVAFMRDELGTPGPGPEESRAALGYFSQYRDQSITYASAAQLVSATLRAFPKTRIVSAMGNPAIAGLLLRDSADLSAIARPVGIRADSLGALPTIPTWAENQWSQYVIDDDPLVQEINERYRVAPVITEWPPQLLSGGTELDYYRAGLAEVVARRVSMTSSTGFPAQSRPEVMDPAEFELWTLANKYAGYRYVVARVAAAQNTLEVSWENRGSAPTYDQWAVTYELVDTLGRVRATIPGGVDLRQMIADAPFPGLGAEPARALATDTVAIPSDLRAGTYTVRVRVQWNEHKADATTTIDQQPMQLALRGRAHDGSYPVGIVEIGR